jgi:TatD DNase family protein
VIDTHAHLDACADPPADVVRRARAAGVSRVLAVGSTLAACRAALEVAEADEDVFAVLGIHPHEADSEEAGRLDELASLLAHEKAIAVGETGLDFFREYASPQAQKRLFERHLELASALGKPVVIHARDADEEIARALRTFPGRVVLHCFSSPGLLPVALERCYYVSFAGNVTYPKAGDLRAAARAVPADRILAETDSPFLAPQPVRGLPNEPAHVVHTLAVLARERGEEPAELGARIDANATEAFSLP